MIAPEIAAWTQRFWLLAGRPEPFPRALEGPIAWALPLAVVKTPRLSLAWVGEHLSRQGLSLRVPAGRRRLRAFLVARAGQGLVFLDGSDPEPERRFSLAHEVGHFLLDHLAPRQDAVEAFGSGILDALDGLREPTPAERLHATLRDLHLEPFTHLLERTAVGGVGSLATLDAEDRADLLALELLAPEVAIAQSLEDCGLSWDRAAALALLPRLLVAEYGLPAWVAERYARRLLTQNATPVTFRAWLGV